MRARQRAGHIVVLASSATQFQFALLAADLDIDRLLTKGGVSRTAP